MKLFHLITTLDIGGAENHLLALLTHLPPPEFEIHLGYLKGAGGLAPKFREAGISVSDFRLKHAADAAVIARIARAIKGHDVLHTHLFKADVFGAAAAKIAGVPRVVSSKHNEDQYLKDFLAGSVGRLAARAADRVVCISEAVKKFMAERGLPAEKLVTIPYGLELRPADDSRRAKVRAQFGAGNEPVVGTMGRFEEQKGQIHLVRAMAAVPGARLVLAGRGSLENSLRQAAAPLGPRAVFAGFRPDVAPVMSAFDVFCLPSLWEGFGLVLLEAMSQKLPVVATTAGSIPEIVVNGETGLLVPPGDEKALASALNELVREPGRAKAMGERGRERLEKKFGIDGMIGRYCELYRGLEEGPGTGRGRGTGKE